MSVVEQLVTFRRLEDINLQAVVDFLLRFSTVSFCPWSDAQLLQKLIDQKQLVGFGAVCDLQLVGVVLGGCMGLRGTINHLAVEDLFRGQKIGKVLVDKMCEYFVGQGVRRMFIFCMNDSIDSLNFWANSQFKIKMNEVTLERDL